MSTVRRADSRRRGLPTCVVADRDRDSLERLCEALRQAPVTVVGTAVEGEEALRLAVELRPAAAVVDVALPGRSGLEIARRLHAEAPATAVVLRSSARDDVLLTEAVPRGVRGHLLRDAPLADQAHAIAAVASGATHFERAGDPLDAREREILRLLADGLRTAEIGKRLYLSPDTVKVHMTKARRKLGARTTTQAVAAALRRSLIS